MKRRQFLTTSAGALAAPTISHAQDHAATPKREGKGRGPNIVYIFSDQWRATDHGYMGNAEVRTPQIDLLSDQSVNFANAVSGIPVCCPHRASLLTGQYPLTHGLFLNDLRLNDPGHLLCASPH